MIKIRCKEVLMQFRTTANRPGQRISTSDCGACDALIFERLDDMVMIHFVRTQYDKGDPNKAKNIVTEILFWPIEVISEWKCEGVEDIKYGN